jgi:hypothetical protein
LTHSHIDRVDGAQTGLEFQATQVHNFEHPGLDRHPFSSLGQALGHQAGDGRAQHGVVQRFDGQIDACLCRPKVGLGGGQAGA